MSGTASENDLRQALTIGEDDDWEFKDGRGGIGKSWAQTVSAFANTAGGHIVCGVESQSNGKTHVVKGLRDAKEYRQKIWNDLHNTDVINRTCCARGDVRTVQWDADTEIVVVYVPPAPRQKRPVYVGKSPYGGTYQRHDEGDYRCSDEEVDQMKRDAIDAPQDSMIIEGSTIETDVDPETLTKYRNRLKAHDASSALLAMDDKHLLKALGAWKDQARPKAEGLTLAGVLMFGTAQCLADAVPGLSLKYLERSSANEKHDHRIDSEDGDWAPNLFNFFFAVRPRLVMGLAKPFALDANAMRKAETPFHDALREALVNALIHADYRSRGAIRVIRQEDAFIFQNPGRSLTPIKRIEQARGAIENLSDIRNPHLAKMFAKIGFAEREGYGYPTIYSAWDSGKRHDPRIEHDLERNLTVVTLPLLSQISPQIEKALQRLVGQHYSSLSALDKDILVHAAQFGQSSTDAIHGFRKEHKAEISGRLRFLADRGWLERQGSPTKRTYALASARRIDDLWGSDLFGGSDPRPTPHLIPPPGPPPKASAEILITRVRDSKRALREDVEAAVMAICEDKFVPPAIIARTLNREPGKLRDNHLKRMVQQGLLQRLHEPAGHPNQAYKTTALTDDT